MIKRILKSIFLKNLMSSKKHLFFKICKAFSENSKSKPSPINKTKLKKLRLFQVVKEFDKTILNFLHCPITKDELEYDPDQNALVSKK